MKKVKLYEQYLVEAEDEKRIKRIAKSTTKFLRALSREGAETKEAFSKIYNSVRSGEKLSDDERAEVGNQLKDVLKTAGLATVAVMPGGIIVALLVKALKLQQMVIPSSFKYLIKD